MSRERRLARRPSTRPAPDPRPAGTGALDYDPPCECRFAATPSTRGCRRARSGGETAMGLILNAPRSAVRADAGPAAHVLSILGGLPHPSTCARSTTRWHA